MTARAVLHSERLTLRPLTVVDADGPYLAWMNDAEVMRYVESRFVAHDFAALAHFIAACNADPATHLFGIYRRDDGRHVGNIKLGPVSTHHQRGDIGIVIGDRRAWGLGIAREAIATVATYAFAHLGLHKLTAGCYAGNVGSTRAFLAAGFVHEATRRAQLRAEGGWQDELLFARFASDA
jgi:ribosomal-protein-alanine N-acetyltransferase